MKQEIKDEMIKAIGSYSNSLIDSIADKCADIAIKHIKEQVRLVNEYEITNTVLDLINQIPQQKQVQYDLNRQLKELRIAANKLGLYDAADFIRNDR